MSCKVCSDQMMGYFDGTLNDIETAQLKQHLKNCSKCSEDFEAYSSVINFLEAEDGIEPPWDFEVNVMEKVNTLEVIRKKRTDKLLIFVYSVSTLALTSVAIWFIAGMREVSLLQLAKSLIGSFSSLSSTMTVLHSIGKVTYTLMRGLMAALFQTALLLVKTYHYAFLVLLAMFLVVQRMFVNLIKQGNGGTKG